ncbi:MAG TPA: class I SAM-dependent methyltransferase [Pyrinomonadaceae bacterium]|nr:class I SAM-dependent methyltransferase [Pyrinomonadaceae bacterium]
MTDALTRFSSRAEAYAKYRPDYPPGVLDILKSECGLTLNSIVADVGSGTGILTELLLKNGNRVFGVEPNESMRVIAEDLLNNYPQFVSVDGSAEATTLAENSVGIIVAAQAFHWFDRDKTKREFRRILKSDGWVVLIWNERRLDSSPFLREYENLLLRCGTDYHEVRHENVAAKLAEFFAPDEYKVVNLDNFQHFDFAALQGRVASASYTPEPGHPNFKAMAEGLQAIFDAHSIDGRVTFEYDTRVYYGHLGK